MAFGIVDIEHFDYNFEEYYDVYAMEYSYDIDKNGDELEIKRFETHQCSDAELGLDDS